ncbi:hypothetical protein Cni_G21979 [Canna indica]|uniref:Uncharacterized protein n=1 Tax=Canna indica TaxID=4628 RepID=A0AAQ3KR44_9LILI|nr:hypothetical protein Cni_G21979 [Canna indica]
MLRSGTAAISLPDSTSAVHIIFIPSLALRFPSADQAVRVASCSASTMAYGHRLRLLAALSLLLFGVALGCCTSIFNFAQALGLPLLRSYLAGGTAEDFRYRANFAFAGATSLNASLFKDKGIQTFSAEYSLGTQLEWFINSCLCFALNQIYALFRSVIFLLFCFMLVLYW